MTELEKLCKAKIPCPETGITVKHTICDICAPSHHCGIDAYVKDGKVIKVEGSKHHPYNRGLLCTKGSSNRDYIYRKDRLKTPMRRVGEKGEGKFEPISWEEAFDEIAARLNKIKEEDGPDSVAVYCGYSKWFRPMLKRFTYSFGSINYATESSVCMDATVMANVVTVGGFPVPDMDHAGVIIGGGLGPHYSNQFLTGGLQAFKERGGKLLIIDPKYTKAAAMADVFLQIKPGTDGALALGIANVIIKKDWYDHGFVENRTEGFDEYAKECAKFDLETVEKITGVPGDKVVAAAELICKNGPACLHQSESPLTQHKNGFNNFRALICLLGLTGNYDKPGANFPVGPFSYNYMGGGFATHEAEYMNSTKPESKNSRIGAGRFPVWNMIQDEFQAMDLSRQILVGKPYPVKALLGFAMNLMMFPGIDQMREALKKLDFFVAVDLFDVPVLKYADIVLPACSSFERGELKTYPTGHAYFSSPVIEPMYDCKSDADIITELARRLCPQDELLCKGYDASIEYILDGVSVTVAQLKAADAPVAVPEAQPPVIGETWKNGLPTPSGKFEFSSNMLKMVGVYPVPNYPEVLYRPEGDRGFLLSTGVRMPHTLHSRLHKVPVLRSLRPEPMADISLEDAKRLGLERGDWVKLTTDAGSLKIKVNPSSAVLAGVIHLYHGYEEVSANDLLTADNLDPCTGFPAYKSIACDMEKCAE